MDSDEELAQLQAAVYSRAGSNEAVVELIDPVTGETVRATRSELRLRALRAERAEQAAGLGRLDRSARVPDAESTGTESPAMPPLAPGPGDPPRRRFVLPLVAAAAFAAGIVTALVATWALAPIAVPGAPGPESTPDSGSASLSIFDFPTLHPDIPVPDFGGQFLPDSIRNVSGTSLAEHGFGVYVGRGMVAREYCLIVDQEDGVISASCAAAADVVQRGLVVQTVVTLRSRVTYDGGLGEHELTATLSPRGEYSMDLTATGRVSIDPPETSGTTVGTWTSEPGANGDFQGEFIVPGEALIVALSCRGKGTVTVALSTGETSVFRCGPDRIENFANYLDAPGNTGVTVTTEGSVTWGLTIATPDTGPASG